MVEGIRLNQYSPADKRRVVMAFPGVKTGWPLNLRDIEEGVDQMNRLPSCDVQIKIEPGGRPGTSLVVIEDSPGKTWRVDAGALSKSGGVTSSPGLAADLTNDLANSGRPITAPTAGSRPGAYSMTGTVGIRGHTN